MREYSDNISSDLQVSQTPIILKVEGSETASYIYVGDCWDGKDYYNSRYVWFLLKFQRQRHKQRQFPKPPCPHIWHHHK